MTTPRETGLDADLTGATPGGIGRYGSEPETPSERRTGPYRVKLDYTSSPWAAIGPFPARADTERDYVSSAQLDHVAACLTDVPFLISDLEIAAIRQDHFPTQPTPVGDGSESPLPYREGARSAAERLQFAIMSVAAITWHRATAGQPNPLRSCQESASWLLANIHVFAQDPDAEQYAHRIADAHSAALDGPIERPPEWQYLGPCPGCESDLETQPGADYVACSCGWRDRTDAVIDRALDTAQDMLFTETQLIGALELDGKIVTRKQIQGWHTRGRLAGHDHKRWAPGGHGRDGKIVSVRTFRLSEVRAIVADLERRAGNRS